MQAYAWPIPATVISEMMGVGPADMPRFTGSIKTLTRGMCGWNMLRTLFWDLRQTTHFMRDLIARNPTLRLAVEPSALKLQKMPMWHRYASVPVVLG